MTTRKWTKHALLVAGLNSCAMASYHFVLPFAWGWDTSLRSLPPAIRWGSYSINFFMSYLMLAGGALTLVAWRRVHSGRPPDRGIVGAMASFWVVNLLYQIFIPMPLPERFLLVRVVLVGFAVVSAGAYLIALGGLRPSDPGHIRQCAE